jgi:hypothetical protein
MRSVGEEVIILNASTVDEIDAAFATAAERRFGRCRRCRREANSDSSQNRSRQFLSTLMAASTS